MHSLRTARFREPVHHLCTRLGHAHPGRLLHGFVEGARSIGHHEHFKTFCQRRQGRERYAHIGHHAGDNQLLAASSLDRLDEVFIVPGVDLAGAGNVRRIREHLFQLGHQRAVRALLEAGSENGRQAEELGQVAQGQHVVLELVGREVLHQRDQAGLVVDQKHHGIVFVQALVIGLAHRGDSLGWENGPALSTRGYTGG